LPTAIFSDFQFSNSTAAGLNPDPPSSDSTYSQAEEYKWDPTSDSSLDGNQPSRTAQISFFKQAEEAILKF